jgi:hypothetical protein
MPVLHKAEFFLWGREFSLSFLINSPENSQEEEKLNTAHNIQPSQSWKTGFKYIG